MTSLSDLEQGRYLIYIQNIVMVKTFEYSLSLVIDCSFQEPCILNGIELILIQIEKSLQAASMSQIL